MAPNDRLLPNFLWSNCSLKPIVFLIRVSPSNLAYKKKNHNHIKQYKSRVSSQRALMEILHNQPTSFIHNVRPLGPSSSANEISPQKIISFADCVRTKAAQCIPLRHSNAICRRRTSCYIYSKHKSSQVVLWKRLSAVECYPETWTPRRYYIVYTCIWRAWQRTMTAASAYLVGGN